MCTQSTSGYWDGCIERFGDLSNISYNGPDSDTLTQVQQLSIFQDSFAQPIASGLKNEP